eukprot:gene9700-10537_t
MKNLSILLFLLQLAYLGGWNVLTFTRINFQKKSDQLAPKRSSLLYSLVNNRNSQFGKTNNTKPDIADPSLELNQKDLSELEGAISQIESADMMIGTAASEFTRAPVINSPLGIEDMLLPDQTSSKEFFTSMNSLLEKYGFFFINGSLEIIDEDYLTSEKTLTDLIFAPSSADFIIFKDIVDPYSTSPNYESPFSAKIVDTTLTELSSFTEEEQTSIIQSTGSPFTSSLYDLVQIPKGFRGLQEKERRGGLPLTTYEENLRLIKEHVTKKRSLQNLRPTPVKPGIFSSPQRVIEWNKNLQDHIAPHLLLTSSYQPDQGNVLLIHNEGILFDLWKKNLDQTLIPSLISAKLIDHPSDLTEHYRSLSWKDLPSYQQSSDYKYLLNNVTNIIFLLNDLSSYEYKKGSLFQPNLVLQGNDDDLMMFATSQALERLFQAINEEQRQRNQRKEKNLLRSRERSYSQQNQEEKFSDRIRMTIVSLSSLLCEGGVGIGSRVNTVNNLFSWINPTFEGRLRQRSEVIEDQLTYFFKEYQYPYTTLHTGYPLSPDQPLPLEGSASGLTVPSIDYSFLNEVEEEEKNKKKLSLSPYIAPVSSSPISLFYSDRTDVMNRYRTVETPFFVRSNHLIDLLHRNLYYPHSNNTVMQVASSSSSTGTTDLVSQDQWDEEFTKFIGPELLRIPLIHCQSLSELLFFLYYQVRETLLSPNLPLVTPIEVIKTYYGLQIRFKPPTSKYDDASSFKQLRQQERQRNDTSNPNKSKYVSPEEERRLELLAKQKEEEEKGGGRPLEDRKNGKKVAYDGGLDIIVESEPYYRIRIKRCLIQKSTVIKEESERIIVHEIKRLLTRLENDYRILKKKEEG